MITKHFGIRALSILMVVVAISSGGIAVARADVTLEQLPDANSHGDFVVGPGKQEVSLQPGESETVELTIANRLGADKIFTISEEDFQGSSDPTDVVTLLGDDRGPYSLKDYIHPATTSVDIPNGYRARVPVVISVPADAQPGGLYGSLVVGTATKAGQSGANNGALPTAALVTRIGTLFFVRVAGPVTESGSLSGFGIAGGRTFILDEGPVSFDLLYHNTGDVYVNPSGTITVTNMLGSPVGSLKIDPWFAMPQSLRFREVVWTAPFLFGRYTAHASINRGYGSTTDEADLVFWVIPWKIILAVLAGLIVIIGGLRWIFSKFKIVRSKE